MDGHVTRVRIFNCLPATLAHYARELAETLSRLDVEVIEVNSQAPIDSATSRAFRGLSHIREIRRIAKSETPTIVIWPGFGWLDGILWFRCRSLVLEISHDPIPIRRQYFSGKLWNTIAKRAMQVEWICHTQSAANAAAKIIGTTPRIALHPVLTTPFSGRPSKSDSRFVISVLGQFKPSRDMDALREIARDLPSCKYDLRIIGRGWPDISGWRVTNRFVSEEELDRALDDSDVVVLPYRQYWQSGIAVRAVERGTSVVGERTEFLSLLMGDEYPGILDDGDSWAQAIELVVERDDQVHAEYKQLVDESWRHIVAALQ